MTLHPSVTHVYVLTVEIPDTNSPLSYPPAQLRRVQQLATILAHVLKGRVKLSGSTLPPEMSDPLFMLAVLDALRAMTRNVQGQAHEVRELLDDLQARG